jgi:hypothetical protein
MATKPSPSAQVRLSASATDATPPPAGAAPNTGKRFGVLLDINGQTVPLSGDLVRATAGSVAAAASQGVDLTLQNPVKLGSIHSFEKWTSAQFGISLPGTDDLPSVLQPVVDKLANMEVTVEYAHLNISGTDVSGVKYTLEANGLFDTPISVFGLFDIKGIVFGVSNEA